MQKTKKTMASSAGKRVNKSAGVFHKSFQDTFDSYIVEFISDFSPAYVRIRWEFKVQTEKQFLLKITVSFHKTKIKHVSFIVNYLFI